jgi:DNA-binding transcriptional LysR family regulator
MFDSDHLLAFEAVARLGSFSAAGRELGLSQPALSRRVQGLEEALKVALFRRVPTGAEPTEAGAKLLAYVRSRKAIEGELARELAGEDLLEGVVRIGGYSSLLHRRVLPAIAPLLRRHPSAQVQFVASQTIRPLSQQALLLQRGEVDLLLATDQVSLAGFQAHRLGSYELVAVESARFSGRENVFLDTRPEDLTTEDYFRTHPSRRLDYRRSFLHDEETILDGVAHGLGRAIIFRAMLRPGGAVRRIEGWPSVRWRLNCYQRKEAHASRLVRAVVEALREDASKRGSP